MRALERDRSKRYASGQAMADDLEAVLRETGFHTRMLPDLLRETFGSDLARSQETLSSMTPELLAALTDAATGSGTESMTASGSPLPAARWKKVAAVAGTLAVTVTLGGLLLARGGGGRSQARERIEAPPAAAVTAPLIQPVPGQTPPPFERRAAPAETGPGASPTEQAAGDDGAHRSKGAHRHHSSHKQRAQVDRVARGLSIDPFKP
jgi:hypothetical protein